MCTLFFICGLRSKILKLLLLLNFYFLLKFSSGQKISYYSKVLDSLEIWSLNFFKVEVFFLRASLLLLQCKKWSLTCFFKKRSAVFFDAGLRCENLERFASLQDFYKRNFMQPKVFPCISHLNLLLNIIALPSSYI